MSRSDLHFEVQGGEIVTLPFSRYGITYYKQANSPQLLARRISDEDDPHVSLTLSEFLAKAWRAAHSEAGESRLDRVRHRQDVLLSHSPQRFAGVGSFNYPGQQGSRTLS